ncbi:MAG: HAMP domain-containing histidine kinase [Proteobacteria bacterium]|nr:HAMP domain-containing histidine kinase [Pseudomonadota bacterium]MCP4916411.1 HAMP domain-containing histidine kinase [Pseudomonadota bacterium]
MSSTLSDAWRGDQGALLGLRWLAGAVLVVGTVTSAAGWQPHWDTPWAVGLTVAFLLSNVAVVRLRPERRGMALVLLADLGIVTALLAMSGGAGTPYSFIYIFPVVVGALLLPRWWAAGLLGAAVGSYLSLFWLAPAELHHHDMDEMQNHLAGMFGGFTVTALVVTVIVTGVRQARIEAEVRLEQARELEERTRRVSALATLAAGAAHELASPLNTILLVSRELTPDLPEHHDDLTLISDEVLRCQDLLGQLSLQAGQGMGEKWVELDLTELVASAVPDAVNQAKGRASLPPRLVAQVLRRLVGNAHDAGATRVEVRSTLGQTVRLTVEDDGRGMDADQLRRAGEPFYTTRPDGRGLGLYFCWSVAEQLGGRFELDSTVGKGTTATLILPWSS